MESELIPIHISNIGNILYHKIIRDWECNPLRLEIKDFPSQDEANIKILIWRSLVIHN
jgi:hypothetical protein